MAEIIDKLSKIRDGITGKNIQNKSNELPSFYETGSNFPAINIMETSKGYKIEMAIPGFSKDDITINADNKLLQIKVYYKGEQGRSGDSKVNESKFCISRNISIPEEVDIDKIDAKMKNGLLTIQLQEKDVSVQKKKISIDVE